MEKREACVCVCIRVNASMVVVAVNHSHSVMGSAFVFGRVVWACVHFELSFSASNVVLLIIQHFTAK